MRCSFHFLRDTTPQQRKGCSYTCMKLTFNAKHIYELEKSFKMSTESHQSPVRQVYRGAGNFHSGRWNRWYLQTVHKRQT